MANFTNMVSAHINFGRLKCGQSGKCCGSLDRQLKQLVAQVDRRKQFHQNRSYVTYVIAVMVKFLLKGSSPKEESGIVSVFHVVFQHSGMHPASAKSSSIFSEQFEFFACYS